jgi:tetratricopeptide (TPR) repeat protein
MRHERERLAHAALLVALACTALAGWGCRQKEAARPAAAAPRESALAERLRVMPPAAQIDTMRALVAADTADAQLRFLSGNAYYEFASALETTAPNRPAYLDSATAQYTRAVTIDSTMSKAWVNLALAEQDRRQPDAARKALERAIAVNPRDVLAWCHLGYLSHMRGDLTEAMRCYNRAVAIDAASAQAHYNLGLAFAEAKIFPEAVREWELVVKYDPDGDLGRTAAENVRIIQQYMTK